MKRAFWLAAVLLLGARAHAAEFDVGTVGGGANALLWPIYIANSVGLFPNAETVGFISAPSSAAVQQQLVAGALNVAVGSGLVDPIRAINEGGDVAIVRLEGQVPPYALLGKSTIKRIPDLKGKTISVGGAKDITRIYLERMLAPNGLKPGDYDLVYAGATSARYAALQSGAADAAMLFPPFNFYAASAGFTNLGLVVDYAPNLPFNGTVVNRQWASGHKDALSGFLAGYTKAVAWFYDGANRDKAVSILEKATHGKHDDIEKTYDFFQHIKVFEPTGQVSRAKLGEILAVLKTQGDVTGEMTVNKLVLPGVTEISK